MTPAPSPGQSPSTPPARSWSSTSIHVPGSSPTVSSPSSSVRGRLPTATASSSAFTAEPRSSSMVTSPPLGSRCTATARESSSTSTPRSRRDAATCSAAKGSSRPSRRFPASIMPPGAQRAPRQSSGADCTTAEDGQAGGDCLRGRELAVGPRLRLVQAWDRRKGGALVPVAMITALPARRTSFPARTRRAPSRRPCCRTSSMPLFSNPGRYEESSR